MATGLLAVAAIVVALVASARVKWLTKTFGVGSVYGIHRTLGLLAVGTVGLHILFVLDESWSNVWLLFPWSGTSASKAADVSTVALTVLIGSAMWRQRRNYDQWRRIHLILAGVVTTGAALHVFWLDHLIADPMSRAWFVGVASLALAGGLYRRVWSPLRNSTYQVVRVHPESPSVSTVTLAPRGGRHRPNKRGAHFAPGQFGWLRFNRRAASADHPYSFSSSAHDAHQVQVTVRRGGVFTESLVSSQPGRPVWIDGPHGGFTPPSSAIGLVLIAAGVGITPMMSILRTCADRRDRRPIRLIQAAESPQELLFDAEIDELAQVLNLEVTQVVTRPHPEWRGLTGRIDLMLLHRVLPGPPMRGILSYFLCGPPSMVTDTSAALTLAGVPPRRINSEKFLMPTPKGKRGAQHARQTSDDAGPRGPRPRPERRGSVGRPADTAPIPTYRPDGTPGRREPELHPRRPTQSPVRWGVGNPVRADRNGPPPRPMPRGEPGAVGFRGGNDPRPGHRSGHDLPPVGH
jgi:predicted ferric reductase